MGGNIVKSGLKFVFEELFGFAISEFVPDIIFEIIGIILLVFFVFFAIKLSIDHFKTPKCEHKRRGVCYQCNPLDLD